MSIGESERRDRLHWHPTVDSLTLTLGHNAEGTLSAQGCEAPLGATLMMGVRCRWGQALFPCDFEVSAHLIPRWLHDGDAFTAPVVSHQRHYFGFELGEYDVFMLRIERLGENVTGLGHGLTGWMIGQRNRCPVPPEASAAPPMGAEGGESESEEEGEAAVVELTAADLVKAGGEPPRINKILNVEADASFEHYCTLAPEAGRYGLALAAGQLGPVMPPGSFIGSGDCSQGYVGPEGVPYFESLGGQQVQCNPRQASNQMQPTVARYTMHVHHKRYADEPLAAREVRPGCISYGQWRRYTVEASGVDAANLLASISSRVSLMLARAGAPPTAHVYDVAAIHHPRSAGGGADTVVGSPCDPFGVRTWHLALYLDEEEAAVAAGIARSEYDLRASAAPARRHFGERVLPYAQGGDGLACCGGMTHYAVYLPSPLVALRVTLNVSIGAVQSVYLKSGSCAAYPADVVGADCSPAVGNCQMTWYVSFDRYTGLRKYAASNVTTVPNGGGAERDKRAMGEWYISVHDAGISPSTHFSMAVDQVADPGDDGVVRCDRYGRYDCSNKIWKVPPDLHAPVADDSAQRASNWTLGAFGVLLLLAGFVFGVWYYRERRRDRSLGRTDALWARMHWGKLGAPLEQVYDLDEQPPEPDPFRHRSASRASSASSPGSGQSGAASPRRSSISRPDAGAAQYKYYS